MTFAGSSGRRSARTTRARSAAASARCCAAPAARAVAVGYDGRDSSPALEAALVGGLTESGVDVVRVGLGPTPMLYYAEAELDVDGGIMITGSHNPADYNGFKMVLGGRAFFGEDIQALGAMAAAGDWEERRAARSRDEDMLDRYVERLLEGFDGGAFRIGWDAGNGAAGPALEKLVGQAAGRASSALHRGRRPLPQPSSRSDRGEEPRRPEGLGRRKEPRFRHRLRRRRRPDRRGRRRGPRDLGRPAARRSSPSRCSRTLPGATIIADVKASQALFDRIAELGGKPLMWKTGHSLIKSKMKETGAPLAGEMSGHIFFAHEYYGFDDALYAAVRLIRAVTQARRLADRAADRRCRRWSTRPSCASRSTRAASSRWSTRCSTGSRPRAPTVDRTDGARVNTADGWWLLRASNTQDVLVARAEAKDQAGLDRLVAQIDEQLALSGVDARPAGGALMPRLHPEPVLFCLRLGCDSAIAGVSDVEHFGSACSFRAGWRSC